DTSTDAGILRDRSASIPLYPSHSLFPLALYTSQNALTSARRSTTTASTSQERCKSTAHR
ncbi:unnamed protein product, partial [Pylaiella littoralis]